MWLLFGIGGEKRNPHTQPLGLSSGLPAETLAGEFTVANADLLLRCPDKCTLCQGSDAPLEVIVGRIRKINELGVCLS